MTFIYHLIIASYFPIHDFFSFIMPPAVPAALWAGRNLPVIFILRNKTFDNTQSNLRRPQRKNLPMA